MAKNMSGKRGTPYVPSYMNHSNGPEPCVVCGDSATGYHYRCMTCEGCKGFFRRTTQKNLKYTCKEQGNCPIDKTTRNQCPECRYRKCVLQGMAVDLVLNDNQRVAKRQLIEQNRERRKLDAMRAKIVQDVIEDKMNNNDKMLLTQIVGAYQQALSPQAFSAVTSNLSQKKSESDSSPEFGIENVRQVADLMTPAITKLINFSKQIPGFRSLIPADQIILLKASCLEIMIFRTATRYDRSINSIVFNEGLRLNQTYLNSNLGKIDILMQLMFNFAISVSRVFLDDTEIAVLVALLLVNSRPGLTSLTEVEKLEEMLLGTLRRYESEKHPNEPSRFARLMVKILELLTVCRQNSDKILCMKLDGSCDVPTVLFETMFCH